MSRKRQTSRDPEADLLVRTYAVTHPPSLSIAQRSFDWHQLAYASHGVMTVRTLLGSWVVPPHRAVWIPAAVEHSIDMLGQVSVRTLFFAPGEELSLSRVPPSCRAVNVSPLLRELILHTVRLGLLYRNVPAQARLAAVLLDQIEVLEAAPLQLPLPSDTRARRAARVILERIGEPLPLEAVARRANLSRRSLERIFLRDTQLTLGRWRQRARLIESLRQLASGRDVTQVALGVGYATPSAFISAFRRHLGTTPGRYFVDPASRSGT